jgi:hypothetical protein
MNATEPNLEHTANDTQMAGRRELKRLFVTDRTDVEDQLFNLGLYARSGLLVKFLLLAEIYKRCMHIPGAMVEFGVWYGQNLVLLENLRAIFEPFHKQRRILGFDTFTGYKETQFAEKGLYSTGQQYVTHLKQLLDAHSQCNVYGHIAHQHELIAGDVEETAPAYFARNRQLTVALAILDMGPYNPTRAALAAIKPHLVKGSLILLDEFTWRDMPGEAQAFRDLFDKNEYRIERLELYPSKVLVTIE